MPLQPLEVFDTADFIVNSNKIDIWRFPLHTESIQSHAILSPDELTRANRYHFAKHKRRFTIARTMLRLIIARYLSVNPKKIIFTYNTYGKPFIHQYPELQFNLTHSKDCALLAIGSTHPIGIDIEYFSARPYLNIGKEIFSYKENIELQNLSQSMRPLGFFHLWAQKEALIKACGLGLSYPTKQFDLPLLPPTRLNIIDPKFKQPWQIYSFMPELACCAAICYHPSVNQLCYLSLKKSDLEF
ncbi:MAG: 4'-phosphopantetheinyl transferase family protein [Legionella sp.]